MIWSDWYDSIVLRTLVLRIVCSIWNFSVVPMKFTCTLEIHVALSCASCNMNFQSGNKFHIALTKMPYKMMFSTVLAFWPTYRCSHFGSCTSLMYHAVSWFPVRWGAKWRTEISWCSVFYVCNGISYPGLKVNQNRYKWHITTYSQYKHYYQVVCKAFFWTFSFVYFSEWLIHLIFLFLHGL